MMNKQIFIKIVAMCFALVSLSYKVHVNICNHISLLISHYLASLNRCIYTKLFGELTVTKKFTDA